MGGRHVRVPQAHRHGDPQPSPFSFEQLPALPRTLGLQSHPPALVLDLSAWLVTVSPFHYLVCIAFLYYLLYVGIEIVLFGLILYYSDHKLRDARLAGSFRYFRSMPAISVALRLGNLEEMLTRRSFRDTFVPAHVRRMTWRW